MKILYFDCFAGISGDMTVAGLLELGVPFGLLEERLAALSLPGPGYHLAVEKVARRGIAASRFHVEVAEHQPHRHYGDIAAMIEGSTLPSGAKERAQRIFLRLAEAEARVHGVEIGRVHFHEVGGVDSIVDIVGTAICLDHLGIDRIHAAPLPYGSGSVETAHGRLPVPAPATVELLRGMPVHFECGPGERVTPTGAAILAALADGFGRPPAMRVSAVGCGAGGMDFADIPNILRLILGEAVGPAERDEIMVIETHIDDMNPELLGFLMERLFAHGALDVAFSPLQMKKNRPAVKLTVLSTTEALNELARMVLTESTAGGVRYYPVERMMLARFQEERETSLGRVRVKVFSDNGKALRVVPEFEECRRIADEQGMPLLEVYRVIERDTLTP
ncbi:MAG TPA: nickel pincer cofactor biosynthesis protein LarC [Geobacteraceae bacterium]|nr:nickel pincer cofactor biosynthesis protein LarC [Geobacteraceae bacterium]